MGALLWRQMLYLTKSRHGVFKYRRAIPPHLREAARGLREFNKSLETRDPREAQKRWTNVHGKFETYLSELEAIAQGPDGQAPIDVQQRIGRDFLKRHGLAYVPLAELRQRHEQHGSRREPSELEQRLALVEDELGIPVDDEEERDDAIHQSPQARAALGTLPQPSYRLSDAMQGYFTEKGYDLHNFTRSTERNHRLLVERIIAGLMRTVGDDVAIEDVHRDHAVRYRDELLAQGKAPATVKKHVRIARAVFQLAIINRELAKANPFQRLPVNDDTSDQERRLPLTPREIGQLLDARHGMNPELADILTILVYTGARLAEISGLAIEDFNAGSGNGPAFIDIKPNSFRRLKTRSSRRQVPLTDEALRTIQSALKRIPKPLVPDAPLFPRYGRSGGSDAASAMLMKALRRVGMSEMRKTIHSIRHSMKDALREVGCPEDIRDAIQGHAQHGVAASYGSGHSLLVKCDWLNRATKLLAPTVF